MSANPDFKDPPDPPAAESGGRGVSDSLESRLTRLETHLQYLATKEDVQKLETHIQKIGTHIQYFEAHIQYFATKEDVQKLKVWWLGGIIAGMGLAATIAASVAVGMVRIFAI